MALEPFDHLILLVGTNPLPDYVAARYLLDELGRQGTAVPAVHLVCSARTRDVAKQLEREFPVQPPWELTDPFNPERIYAQMEEWVGALNGTVHLNYTGGTKAMSVEAVAAALEVLNERSARSYLSAQDFKLHVHHGSRRLSLPRGRDLRSAVSMDLQRLFQIHQCEWRQATPPWALWPNSAAEYLKFDRRLHNRKPYEKWRDQTFPETRARSRAEFERELQTWQTSNTGPLGWPEGFDAVVAALETEACYVVRDAPVSWSLDQAIAAHHFVRGGWLEQVVGNVAASLETASRKQWSEVSIGVRAIRKGASERHQMELDVVALRGYTLTLFSCAATMREKEIKLKAFEALHRAHQLGGDEALAVVVCPQVPGVLADLYHDLATDYGTRPPLRFVSRTGLSNLEDSLRGIAEARRGRPGLTVADGRVVVF